MKHPVHFLAALGLCVSAACQNSTLSEAPPSAEFEESASAPASWNVVVLVPDTFRGDRISANGYDRETTPNLDKLAAEGVNFRNAATVAPRTWQSFSSILTGRYPPGHGVRYIFAGKIPDTVAMLGPYLRDSGYETAAFDPIRFLSGMTQEDAFDAYITPSGPRKPGESLDDPVMHELEKFVSAERNQPFLAFVRLTGAHWPYTDKSFLTEEHDCADYPHTFNTGTYGTKIDGRGLQIKNEEAFRKMIWTPDANEKIRQHRIAHYDSEIHLTDELIGSFIEKMRRRGLLENTIIAVTSDHGESFGEHGYMQHGPRVDESVMHVPLIIRLPEGHPDHRPGTVVESQVRVIDLFPTLVDALGLPPPPATDGTSLLPLIRDETGPSDLLAYGEAGRSFMGIDPERHLEGVEGKHRMVRSNRWKLVYIPNHEGGKRQLFDIVADPEERHDLADQHPRVVEKLFAELEKVDRNGIDRGVEEPLTEDQLERLRQLGYVQ